MGRQVVGITTQKVQYTINAVGTVSDPYCETDPEDCCSGSGGADCCADPEPFVDYFSTWPTFDPEVFVNLDSRLQLGTPPGQVYEQIGGAETSENIQLTFKLVCVDGVDWAVVGNVNYLELGPIYFNVVTVPDGDYLFADIEIPGYGTATIATAAPCGVESGGGGTSFCGCTSVPTTLYVEFAGALAAYGVQTLTYDPLLLSFAKSPAPTGICGNNLNYSISLTCTGGTTFQLSMPASLGTGFTVTATATSCTPLVVDFAGTTNDGLGGPGACPGAFTAQVRTTI